MENKLINEFKAFLDSQEAKPVKSHKTNAIIILALTMLVSCGKKVEKVVGTNGLDGQSCYSETVQDGVNVICGESTSFIPNGQDGIDGTFNGYLEYVEVCPQINGQYKYKETLLNLDGTFLSFLTDANYKKQRLVKLPENQVFKTTDNRNVSFSIINGQIICL